MSIADLRELALYHHHSSVTAAEVAKKMIEGSAADELRHRAACHATWSADLTALADAFETFGHFTTPR